MTAMTTSNRGFWLVTAPIAALGVLLIVLILVFRPRVDPGAAAIAQRNLRTALAAAERIRDERGSFAAASTLPMRDAAPDLLFIDPDQASNDPGVISVSATDTAWAGAARASDGTCFWIRAQASGPTVTGIGSDCSGDVASTAEGSTSGW